MRMMCLAAVLASLGAMAPAYANVMTASAQPAPVVENAGAPALSVFAPSFRMTDDVMVFSNSPALLDTTPAPQELSEPSSAGLLFFGAGLIGLCYMFDALVRSRKTKSQG